MINLLRRRRSSRSTAVKHGRHPWSDVASATEIDGLGGNGTRIMDNQFFEQPILNSPYEYPARHWELDESGQPTERIIQNRRPAEFITPVPKPKKRRGSRQQGEFVFDEGKGLSTEAQQYDPTSIINGMRQRIELSSGGRALLKGRGPDLNAL